MALEPNIILQAGNFKTPDYGETMERRAAIQLRNAEIARAQRTDQMAQAKTVRLGDIGNLASTGDLAGARKTALAGGDFDILETINKLDEQQRTSLQRRVETAAPLAFEAAKLPYEQRKGFITAQTPRLLANGWTPEELANFDPSDQALGSIVASAQSITDMLKRQDQRAEFDDKRADRASDREFQRGNAYIAAGLIPPGSPASGSAPSVAGGAPGGRTQFGWTPRARNGGNNSDAAVDGKVAGMAQVLGRDPDAEFGNLSPREIAQALTLSEGGAGSIADRNNNPGNITDGKGRYRRFPTKEAGLAAAEAQVRRNLARGQNTIRKMVEGLPVGGASAAPRADGLQVIPGGKLDKPKAQRMTKAEIEAEGLDPNMAYYRDANGLPQAVSGQSRASSLKAAPSAALTNYQENMASRRQIQKAIQLLDPNNNSPEAKAARASIGPGTGALGDTFTQWNDPKGNDFRAQVGRIGGIIIKDTSGAAVSASEDSRLAKWVPLPTDTIEGARAKLRQLDAAIGNTQTAFEEIYNEDNGYRPMRVRGTLAPRAAAAPPKARAPSVGTVQRGYRFKGGDPAKPGSWEKVR